MVSEKNVITPPTTKNGVWLEISKRPVSFLLRNSIARPEIKVDIAFNLVALMDVSMLFWFISFAKCTVGSMDGIDSLRHFSTFET